MTTRTSTYPLSVRLIRLRDILLERRAVRSLSKWQRFFKFFNAEEREKKGRENEIGKQPNEFVLSSLHMHSHKYHQKHLLSLLQSFFLSLSFPLALSHTHTILLCCASCAEGEMMSARGLLGRSGSLPSLSSSFKRWIKGMRKARPGGGGKRERRGEAKKKVKEGEKVRE